MSISHVSPRAFCIMGSVLLCLLSVICLLPTQNIIDVPIRNTYFPIVPFDIAAGFTVLFIAFACVYAGFPRLVGRSLSDRLTRMHLFLTLGGALALMLTFQIASILSQKQLAIVLLLACAVIVVAQLFFAFNLLWSLFR